MSEKVVESTETIACFTTSVNRPGFPRGLFVQNSGGFFKSIHLCMEFVLQFLRRPMAIGAV